MGVQEQLHARATRIKSFEFITVHAVSIVWYFHRAASKAEAARPPCLLSLDRILLDHSWRSIATAAFWPQGKSVYSTLKLNSCVATTSPPSVTQLYCIMAALTAAWNTRGPDRMVTSWITPPLM